MGTRATYQFLPTASHEVETWVYIHYDGYPKGAADYFYNVAKMTAKSKGGMAEHFIRANPEHAELTKDHHGDTQYHYTVMGSYLQVDDIRNGRLVYCGPLADFVNEQLKLTEYNAVEWGKGRLVVKQFSLSRQGF